MCPTQDSAESDVEFQTAQPIWWDGTACLDWDLRRNIECSVIAKEGKWADHKLLQGSIPRIGISRIRISKFTPRPNLVKLENIIQDRWNDVLRQNWLLLKDEIPTDPTWECLRSTPQVALH